MPLNDRSFDLVQLSNWEDQIIYDPQNVTAPAISLEDSTNTPINKVLESGVWTQSIIWGPNQPFRDFTQLEFNHEDDVVPEERTQRELIQLSADAKLAHICVCLADIVRPRKRLRTDAIPAKDKFNLSNDHLYEVSKEGARARVRQTFGQLTVEHAYPAQKLQLPFVRYFFVLSVSSTYLYSLVQNTSFETGSAIFPPSSDAIPF